MIRYVIVETTNNEFKIGTISYRYVSETPLYMLLANTYYIGPEGKSQIRKNSFPMFVEAEQAINELMRGGE